VIGVRCLFLLDFVLEDADVFAGRYLHGKHLILRITDDEAVEREHSRGINCINHIRRIRTRKLATYQALLPGCVGHLSHI